MHAALTALAPHQAAGARFAPRRAAQGTHCRLEPQARLMKLVTTPSFTSKASASLLITCQWRVSISPQSPAPLRPTGSGRRARSQSPLDQLTAVHCA